MQTTLCYLSVGMKPSFVAEQSKSGVYFSSIDPVKIPVYRKQFCYADASATVLSHFLAVTQAHLFAVRVAPNICNLAPVLSGFPHFACVVFVVSYCLNWNLLLKIFSLICNLLSGMELPHLTLLIVAPVVFVTLKYQTILQNCVHCRLSGSLS